MGRPSPGSSLVKHQVAVVSLGLALITVALYLPSLRHSFLDFDDQQYVTENLIVRSGLTLKGMAWAFGFHASNWHPLTWLSHMLDCQLFGLNPTGHHFTSVLLHVANTALLFLLLNQMTGSIWRSATVAALFGWHPLHVESVAWVAERKDVLSAFFWMLAIWAYVQSKVQSRVQSPKSKVFYLLSLVFFALGLMSKPMVVTLPFVFLLLDVWPLGRVASCRLQVAGSDGVTIQPATCRRLILEKWPFFVLTGIACLMTLAAQQRGYAVVSTGGLPLVTRVEHSLTAYIHYSVALFVPRHLAVYYPYETTMPLGRTILSGVAFLAITLLALRWFKPKPYLLIGWLWFVGTLVPVIGLVQVGDQAWADRYTYLPLIGLFIALVWTLADLMQVNSRTRPGIIALSLGALTAQLSLTSIQLTHWRNTRILFEHANKVTRDNHLAVAVLGSLLAKEGKLTEAVEKYHEALRYKPNYPEAHFFLGNAYDQQGKLDDAISEYQKALPSKAIAEQTHMLLGSAFSKKGDLEQAAKHYSAALQFNPESPSAHHQLGRVLQTQGKLDDAIVHYTSALKLDPGLGPAHNNLAVLLMQKGNADQSLWHLREAARLQPDNLETEYNLALALHQQGKWAEAAELFARTISGLANDPKAHYQFGLALAHLHKTRDAMAQFANALLLQQDFPDALDQLSSILATDQHSELRNGPEAVRMAERACELTGRKDAAKLCTLAAAYAEVGRFDDAIATIQRVLELASSPPLRSSAQLMLDNFKNHRPWRNGQ